MVESRTIDFLRSNGLGKIVLIPYRTGTDSISIVLQGVLLNINAANFFMKDVKKAKFEYGVMGKYCNGDITAALASSDEWEQVSELAIYPTDDILTKYPIHILTQQETLE